MELKQNRGNRSYCTMSLVLGYACVCVFLCLCIWAGDSYDVRTTHSTYPVFTFPHIEQCHVVSYIIREYIQTRIMYRKLYLLIVIFGNIHVR